MKRLIIIFTIFLSLVFICCEKPGEDPLGDAIKKLQQGLAELAEAEIHICDSIYAAGDTIFPGFCYDIFEKDTDKYDITYYY